MQAVQLASTADDGSLMQDMLSTEAAAAVEAFCAQTAHPEVFARRSPELAALGRTVAKALFEHDTVGDGQSSAGEAPPQLHVEGFDAEQIWAQLEAHLGVGLGKVRAVLADLAARRDGLRLIDEETEGQLAELTKMGRLVDGVEEEGSSEGDKSGESEGLGEGSLGAMDDDELEAEIRRLEALNRKDEGPLKPTEDYFLRIADMERFVLEAEAAAGEESGEESSSTQENEAGTSGTEEDDSEEEDAELARMLEARSKEDASSRRLKKGQGDQADEEEEEGDIMYADFFEDKRSRAGVDVDREDGEEEQVTEGLDGEVVGSELATAHAMRGSTVSDEEGLEGAGEQPGPQGAGSGEALSAHERRVARMAERARALEAQNLVQKDWFMRGEAGAARRPLNSALEVDVDFERGVAPPPQPSEESTASLEDMIKQRIAERQFDDPPRVVAPAPEAPRPALELDDKMSQQGLGELYEEEYVRRAAGNAAEDKDEKVRMEARALLKVLFGKLDALSHFHYAPRPVAADLSVRPEVPALALEDVTSQVVSEASRQLPEEVYKPPAKGAPIAEAELSHEDRGRRRAAKKRAAKKHRAQKEAEANAKVLLKGRKSAAADEMALAATRNSTRAAAKRKRQGVGEETGQKGRMDYTKSAAVFAQLQEARGVEPAKQAKAGTEAGSRVFKL